MRIRDSLTRSRRSTILMTVLAAACGGSGSTRSAGPSGGDAVLTDEDLRNQTYSRVEEMIAARVPGVQVLRLANGDYSLRIRGTSSISGSNEPLIIIDGAPVQSGAVSSALATINPEDVARIEVLKDAQSTSFYGVRGANGVIVITTKRRQ